MQKLIEIATFKSLIKKYNISFSTKNIVDAGCGAGYGLNLINHYFAPNFLAGFDIDPKEVIIAKRNCPSANIIKADILDLPYSDSMFDMVFAFTVIHHVPEWKKSFLELHRVLNTDGILLINELNNKFLNKIDCITGISHPKESRFTWMEFESTINNSNFSIICKRKVTNIMSFYICRKNI